MLQEHTTAVLMLCATIPRDRSTVHVNLVILEMEELAKVSLVISIYLYKFKSARWCFWLTQCKVTHRFIRDLGEISE